MANSKVRLTIARRGNRSLSIAVEKHQRERALEFKSDSKDYSIPEFYATFQDCLPLIVVVTQGYFGDICNYSFNRKQILYINAVSKQNRVVARFISPVGPKLLSIPDIYAEKFCVVTESTGSNVQVSDKADPEENHLYILLRTHKLPISVRFPKDRTIKAGTRTIKTDNIKPFHLIQTFDEVNMLGNFVDNARILATDTTSNVCAEMNPDVLQIPLYLSQLRVAVVTGIINQPIDVWASFKQELKRLSAQIEYDMQSGNINIAEYASSALQTATPLSYIQPKSYVNISSLVLKQPATLAATTEKEIAVVDDVVRDVHDVYEELDEIAMKSKGASGVGKKTCTSKAGESKEYEALKTTVSGPPLPRRPSDKINSITDDSELLMKGKSSPSAFTAELKSRLAVNRDDKQRQGDRQGDDSSKTVYKNDIPRSTVQPTSARMERSAVAITSGIVTGESSNPAKAVEILKSFHVACHCVAGVSATCSVTSVNSAEDVGRLTILEVCDYLKKLNLAQYISLFKEQQVDGALLMELDRDILQTEFGMTGMEAIKLYKFAQEGHIPS